MGNEYQSIEGMPMMTYPRSYFLTFVVFLLSDMISWAAA